MARGGRGTRVEQLFRRANRRQRAVVVVCGLLALHGLWVIFVPGVDPEDSALPCPPAIVAAMAGSSNVETPDASTVSAERHDAACAAAGRWWVVAGGLQIVVALLWAQATLEWARHRRRVRRRRARQSQEAQSKQGERAPAAEG